MITKSLSDVENRENREINPFAENFEKDIDDVHRESRKVSKLNDTVADEDIAAFLAIQRRTGQSQINNSSREKAVSRRAKDSRDRSRENDVEKEVRAKKKLVTQQKNFQTDLIVSETSRKTVPSSASNKKSKPKKIMHIDNAFDSHKLILIESKAKRD